MATPLKSSSQKPYKTQLATQFGEAADLYNHYAIVQRQCAADLVSMLRTAQPALPAGTILEIGCGTGFVTQELLRSFPHHSLDITDLSATMVDYAYQSLQAQIQQHSSISFRQMDGERPELTNVYAAIASGFVVQWFEDIVRSLHQLGRLLLPGGYLVASFPTCNSFPEWKSICRQANLPFTGNPLPDVDILCQALTTEHLSCDYQDRWIATTHDRALDFFRGLKRIGAGLQQSSATLSAEQFRQLVQTWDAAAPEGIQVSYHIACLRIHRQPQ